MAPATLWTLKLTSETETDQAVFFFLWIFQYACDFSFLEKPLNHSLECFFFLWIGQMALHNDKNQLKIQLIWTTVSLNHLKQFLSQVSMTIVQAGVIPIESEGAHAPRFCFNFNAASKIQKYSRIIFYKFDTITPAWLNRPALHIVSC